MGQIKTMGVGKWAKLIDSNTIKTAKKTEGKEMCSACWKEERGWTFFLKRGEKVATHVHRLKLIKRQGYGRVVLQKGNRSASALSIFFCNMLLFRGTFSWFKRRVETFELDACISRGKTPIDSNRFFIAMILPSLHFALQLLLCPNPTREALAGSVAKIFKLIRMSDT
jgi:hypothetical protein